jgi:hypothetical protein
MMVTVAWTWASRRSNGHSVTQQSVQDDNTRYTDDGNNRTMMANTVASKAGGVYGKFKIRKRGRMISTNLTREGKGRRRAEGEATHNIEILFHWRRDRRGSLQSTMTEASEGVSLCGELEGRRTRRIRTKAVGLALAILTGLLAQYRQLVRQLHDHHDAYNYRTCYGDIEWPKGCAKH